MRPLAVLLILLGALLAGCTGGSDGPPPDDPDQILEDPDAYYAQHHCVRNDVTPRVLAPDAAGTPWRIGQWWEYDLGTDARPTVRTKMAYFADRDHSTTGVPQHYMVGTATRDDAVDHALWSTNPVVGRIHRLLYSPHEAGVHADMFNFPLCQGNSWSNEFFGRRFQMEASPAPVDLPGGNKDASGFHIDGTASDGSTLWYTFSPEAKWFTRLRLDRADGRTVEMTLRAHGSGASGAFHFLRGQDDAVLDVAALGTQTPVVREPGGEGAYERLGYHLSLRRESGDGEVELWLEDPAGNVVACVGVAGSGLTGATDCPAGPLQEEVPWQEGTWTVRLQKPPLGQVSVTGEVRIVSIYDRGGTIG